MGRWCSLDARLQMAQEEEAIDEKKVWINCGIEVTPGKGNFNATVNPNLLLINGLLLLSYFSLASALSRAWIEKTFNTCARDRYDFNHDLQECHSADQGHVTAVSAITDAQ
ncbi:Mucin-2 [Manis pentadactyla]|nr:Mucin-2 [Manis pentadactyla]